MAQLSPYVSVSMLLNAPTGAPWDIVPNSGSSGTAAQIAETTNILWRASSRLDRIANQPVRATVNSETLQGPDFRLTVDNSGVGRFMTSRWPVTQVLGGQVSPRATIPRSWSTIPVTAMDMEEPPMTLLSPAVEGASGAGGNAILIAPGYVSWANGRNGYTCQVSYVNGWPHCGVTAAVTAGAAQFDADDVSGMAAGTACFWYDGSATEVVTVDSATATAPVTLPSGGTAPAGPGTVTLTAATQYAHEAGTIVSALPQDIAWAVIELAAAQVLSEGATAVAIPEIAGALTSGGKGVDDLVKDAKEIIAGYHRIL